MTRGLYPTEVLDHNITISMSVAMYRGLMAKYVAERQYWDGMGGFETFLREYLRGLAFGPGVERGDYEDHTRQGPA